MYVRATKVMGVNPTIVTTADLSREILWALLTATRLTRNIQVPMSNLT